MIRQNIIANMAARVWGFVSVYLFVPLYLRFLGIEAYGLVGFYSILLGVVVFADMGFTATLNREMARLSVRDDAAGEMRDLLRTYETVYVGISSMLAVLIYVLSPVIAEHWVRSSALPPDEIATAVGIMGISIALQLPSGLYIGGLMGLQKQVRANSIQVSWGAFRGIGAVLVLWLVSPTIVAFAVWQLVSNAVYFLCARFSLWRVLSSGVERMRPRFRREVFRNTWRYAAGMAGMAVASTLLTQTDKLAVSKMLPLEMLGYYTIAGTLAALPLMLASPIGAAAFPRFTGLVEVGDRAGLARLYHRTCELVSVVILPAGLTVAFFAGDFIFAWTGSAVAAGEAGFVASLLLAGQVLQAITVAPYYLSLAHGSVRLNLWIGIVSVLVITPLLILLIMRYGMVGAGVSWLAMNICTFVPYMCFLHRRFMPGELQRWFLTDVGTPLLGALPLIVAARVFLPHPGSRIGAFLVIGMVWGMSAAASAIAATGVRGELVRMGRKILGVPNGV